MRKILLVLAIVFLGGCDNVGKLDDETVEFGIASYEYGYSQGVLDQMNGSINQAKRGAEFEKFLRK